MNLTTTTTWNIPFNQQVKVWRRWYLTIFAITLFITGVFALQALAKTLPTENSVLIALANEERANQHLTPLKPNHLLEAAALAKAEDMFRNQYFEHISPAGRTPWQFITEAGYHYTYAGENLAIDFSNLPATHDAWMNSPSHRANILETHYRDVGIATVKGQLNGRPTYITVQMFGTTPADSLLENLRSLW